MSKRARKSQTIEPAQRPRNWDPLPWLMGAVLVAMVFVAYRPAARGEFIWDDNDYVSENPTLLMPGGLWVIWAHPSESPQYYPLVFTTFWVEARMWGPEVRGYHETNILLHAGSAVLLWRILRWLGVPGAYFAAAIFAVHPVMVESVAWVTERKNTLSMFFYLGAVYSYLRFWARPASGPAKQDGWGWYGAALGLFVCALLSKTVTATLPAAMLLILWWKRGRMGWRDVLSLAPFFLLGVAGGVLTGYLERTHVGASGAEWNYSLTERLLIAGRAVWFYAGKLVWPADLSFIYPKWAVGASSVAACLFPIAFIVMLVVLFVARGRLGWWPLVAVLLFAGTLTPALGFVNVYPMRYTFVADHYQYHASVALIALFAAGAALAWRRWARGGRWVAARLAGVGVVAVLFVLTWRRAGIYRDQRTLWTDTVERNPESWMVWINLGQVARRSRPPDLAGAGAANRRALALAPDVADTHFEMAQTYVDESNYPAAIAELERTVAIEPRHAAACNLMGFVLRQMNQPARAAPWLGKAIELDPRDWRAHFNLGRALKDLGRPDEAANHFARSLEINPRQVDAYFQLADCDRLLNRLEPARAALEALLEWQPENAEGHMSLAAILRRMGRDAEADFHRSRALMLKPELGKLLERR